MIRYKRRQVNIMNKKYYHIITYGCQMNEHDSEKMGGILEKLAYIKTSEIEKANIIILNTCMIRENAELKLFGKVGSLKKLKEEKDDLIIGVSGCMMQTEENRDELYKKYPQVDFVMGTHNFYELPEILQELDKSKKRIFRVWPEGKGLLPELPVSRAEDFKAWVSIIRGCNNFCTYCIVPYVRGREISRPINDILTEIKKLVINGVIEVTLLGQNVNSYGHDLKEDIDFADLLAEVAKINGLKRIRYMTSHPRDFTEGLIEVIKENENICNHFHLPVQSGSSRILKKMNRGYDRKKYLNLITKIKKEIPDAGITTDIIVGFPGEKEKDFNDTLSLIEKVHFDMAFTFIYSPRPGTPAAKFNDKVADEIKKTRLQRLMEIQNKISLKKNQEMLGKNYKILVEGESKNNPDNYMGRTFNNKPVIIPGFKSYKKKILEVKINKVNSFTLYGEIMG